MMLFSCYMQNVVVVQSVCVQFTGVMICMITDEVYGACCCCIDSMYVCVCLCKLSCC